MPEGLVLRAQSGFFQVETGAGVVECTLRGRLKKERQSSDIAVIGDRVRLTLTGASVGVIEQVLPRQSRLARRAPFNRGQWSEDVLVANVDQVILVFACTQPEFSPRMLDRYLVLIEESGLEALIVATKADLVAPEQAQALFAPYDALGYPVIIASSATGAGIAAVRGRLAGRVSVVTGRSGVGKSSLLNAVQPGLGLAVGDVSVTLNKGRHTTTVAELHRVADDAGGYVADTPGIRELGLWRFPLEDLDWCFREFRPFRDDCRFAGCSHTHEPQCAVLAALARGDISAERHASYVKLRETR
ncbi:MAG: ribosome small subunit-dependent GTPase A [Chloroflexi bacterium]|nr:ribosome small subunit-dependent GTPase A [Chloroflexota bacterium]